MPKGDVLMGRRSWQRSARVAVLALAAGTATLSGTQASLAAAPTVTVQPGDAVAIDVVHVLGLGDSTLSAEYCDCPGLLLDYAGLAGERLRTRVQVRNYAGPSATTEDTLRTLRKNRARGDVRSADLVIIFIGANDFAGSFNAVARGGSAEHNFGPVADRVQRNVGRILGEIKALNG